MTLRLGCIADDLTGATDLASMLVKNRMSVLQHIGVPDRDAAIPDAQAVVIALKSRTASVATAIDESVRSLKWLQDKGASQFFFKYCSTFDSTDRGNIGPVIDALLDDLGEGFTVCCPAYPENRRTVYQGHLFVGDRLLSESGMEHHPLTPMADSDLVRVLGRQATGRVGLIPFQVVDRGCDSIRTVLTELRSAGTRYAIVDALSDHHLVAIGQACNELKLVTGGSGVAMGLPENYRRRGLLLPSPDWPRPAAAGYAAVIAGSCSRATLSQVEVMRQTAPAFHVDTRQLMEGVDVAAEAIRWAEPRLGDKPVLIYSTTTPETLREIREALGAAFAGALVEQALAKIAAGLMQLGVRRLVIAGGETAGAALQALGLKRLYIAEEIAPGVPWTCSIDEPRLWLALKSGNFGDENFFAKAFQRLS